MIRRHLGELLLLLGSLLAVALLVGFAELAARVFSSVDLVGNSRDLFVARAWGKSHGNAPDIEAISFGQKVYTDEHGFRIPKRGVREDAGKREAILILGDSVAFGPAVEEEQTIAGLLRAHFPDQRIYNSSVIGFTTADYRNVVDAFVPLHQEVTAVALVYCLNDVSVTSARNIEREVGKKNDGGDSASSLTETLRGFTWISDANDYLRSRSKLYLLIRHRLLGTQTRDWHEVLQLYGEDHTEDVEQAASDIAAIAALLKPRGIRLVVVLAPFEYQLGNADDPDTQLPQRTLTELLRRAGVDPIDPRPDFDASRASDYYLAYDAMHFSAAGHRVIADVIAEALRAPRTAAK